MIHQITALLLNRDSARALEHSRVAMAVAEEHDLAQWKAFASMTLGWALAKEGDVESGIEKLRQGLDSYRAIRSEASRPRFLAVRAEALLKSGRFEEAATALQQARDDQELGSMYSASLISRLQGELLLARAADPEARAVIEPEAEILSFREAIEIAVPQEAALLPSSCSPRSV